MQRRLPAIGTLQNSRSAYRLALRARSFELLGGAMLRYGLVLFLVLFGVHRRRSSVDSLLGGEQSLPRLAVRRYHAPGWLESHRPD
jgi:hypothetical protein